MSPIDPPDPALLPEAPQPRLSPVRVVIALLLVLLAGGGGFLGLRHTQTVEAARADAALRQDPWFAPYVDATLTPTVAFQDAATNPSRNAVLGFVVAGTGTPCAPSWGTYATLDEAASTLDLDRRVAQLRGRGGNAVIAFGGAVNSELAVACEDPDALAAAYRAVVDRYDADTIDFDIEGPALADAAANARRAEAVKAVQEAVEARKGRLAVWLTLPVTPEGLNPDALAVVQAMLAAKVDLAGVNVMAMDFGVPSAARDMPAAIAAAVTATHGQLAAVSARAGVPLDARAAWGALGVTVMIGQNDVDGERLTVAGARKVAAFAADHGLGRVSMWSLNRDAPCGATFAIIGTHSNTCSGVAQGKLAFSSVFARLSGRAGAHTAAGVPASGALVARATTVDDPARSPYPIWDPQRAYREGYKVVWHQAVYVAKWYSQGQTPDAENVLPANAAWRLVGPVLASDRAPVIPRLPAGTHPAWKAGAVYRAGDRVLFHGLPYQASWYTQGDAPDSAGANGSPSPWKPLYRIPGEPADG